MLLLPMDEFVDANPRDQIDHLEAQIERLAATIESCRKFILAGRLAVVLGGGLIVAGALGMIAFGPVALCTAIVAVLGGVVMLGSNDSTAKQAAAELQAAQARRTELIGGIPLRLVSDQPTLH
jgi:acetoin utilization deacetylase AcuC-like enzyme